MAPILIPIYLLAAASAALTAALIFRRRTVRGGVWLAFFLSAAAYWAFFNAMELTGPTVESRRVFAQFQYLGIVMAAPAFFHAAFAMARRRRPWPLIALVWSVPLLTLPVAWTSARHQLLWTSIDLNPATGLATFHYGPWFWLFMAHAYLLLLAAVVVIVAAARQVSTPFRAPLWAMVAAVSLPWIGNAIHNFKLGPPLLEGIDLGALGLVAMGMLLARAVWWEGLLDVFPKVWETLLDGLSDGVIVARHGVVSFANPSARHILGMSDGRSLSAELLRKLKGPPSSRGTTREVQLPGDGGAWVEVRTDVVRDRWGDAGGEMLIVRDASARKSLESEREQLITDLSGALAEVRALQELLPVCSWCKKVRDDSGYWDQLDQYLGRRVRLSHGICPECHSNMVGEPTT
jgi:PAS domain-containing protein